MALIKKSWIKLIKQLLVSKPLQIISLILYIISIILITLITKINSIENLSYKILRKYRLNSNLSIYSINDYWNYINSTFLQYRIKDNYQVNDIFLNTTRSIISYIDIGNQTNNLNISNSDYINQNNKSISFSIIKPIYKGIYNNYYLIKDLNTAPKTFSTSILDLTINTNEDIDKLYYFYKDFEEKYISIIFICNIYSIKSNKSYTIITNLEREDEMQKIPDFTYKYIIYDIFTRSNNYVLLNFGFFMLFVSIIYYNLMLIYEINIIPNITLHLFSFFGELFSIMLIFMFFLYDSIVNISIDSSPNELYSYIGYIDFLSIENINEIYDIILSLNILCVFFKILKLLSHFEIFNSVYKYVNVIYKLGPLLLICLFIFGGIWILSSCIVWIIYGCGSEYNSDYSNFFYVFIYLLKTLLYIKIEKNLNANIRYDILSYSNILKSLIILVLLILLIFTLLTILSTIFFNIKFAFNLEFNIEDPINTKIKNIINILEQINSKDVNKNRIDSDMYKHEIIWLNLTDSNKNFQFSSKNNANLRFIHFKYSKQVISYMKYIFGLCPKLQYNQTQNRFTILIQIYLSEKTIPNENLDEIEILINWLNFIRSKITIIYLSNIILDKNTQCCIDLSYDNVGFCIYDNGKNIKNTTSSNVYLELDHFLSELNKKYN